MRLGRFAPLMAAIVCAVISWGGGAAAQAPLKIRIAWVVPIANWASVMPEKTDIMQHYGKSYTIEATHFQSTPTMIQALGAGELDIADLAFSSFAIAVENAGMTDLRVIADEARDGYQDWFTGQYMVLKDGPVKTIDDLKGKLLATVGVGSAVDIPVRALLRQHGLEDRRDYTTVEAPFPSMAAMLMDKKADFVPTVPPFSLAPAFAQNARTLFTVKDALGGSTEFIIWAAHASFIQQHHAEMLDFMEDAVRAARWFTDPANHDAVVQICAKIMKMPPDKLGWAFTKVGDYQDPNMVPDLASFQRAIDIQQQTGFLKAKLDVQQYADLQLLKDATARIK